MLIECVLKDLRNSPAVDFGINSTYLHAHMPKINSSSVEICESSQKVLRKFSKSSRPKILNCYPRRSNTFVTSTFLSPRRFFVHREHRWGNHMGKIYGVTIFTLVTNLISVLAVPKLQKTIPRNVELPATLCQSVA